MPRTARKKSETGIYHVLLRGINRQTIFEDDEDAVKFLQTLEKYKQENEYEIYAYCLMGNHIHILIKENQEELGNSMRRIGASYVYWYNWKYERTGHLFQDRYKSEVVENDRYLLTVLRYIHQNPLKAGIVNDINEYKWSSYFEYLDKNKKQIVDKDFILEIFDRDKNKAKTLFEEFHRIEENRECLEIYNKKRFKDKEAKELIIKICNVENCKDLQEFNKNERNNKLNILKEKGLSTRQLSRLTGISRGIILKV
jgi:REP element-mobilizing transposase RayT